MRTVAPPSSAVPRPAIPRGFLPLTPNPFPSSHQLEARVLDKRRESLAAAIARLRASRDPSNRDTRAAAVVAAAAAAAASAEDAETALAVAAEDDALRDRVDDPVFETLSAPKLLHALNDALRMFADDVEVKSALLEEVERAATRATTTGKETDGEDEGMDLSHETLTTCVATWILSPMLDEEALAEMEAVVAMETK